MKSKHVLILAAVIVVVGAWFALVHKFVTLDLFIRMVQRVQGHRGAAVIFMLTYALFCLFAPISVFPVAGGVLFGFWRGLLYNALGSNGGALLAFGLSRTFRAKFAPRISEGRLKKFNAQIKRHGRLGIFSMRILGLPPFILLNYSAGISTVPVTDYVIGTFFGMLPWKIAVTYFANTLWQTLLTAGEAGFSEAVRRLVVPVTGGFVLIAALVITVWLTKERRLDRKERSV